MVLSISVGSFAAENKSSGSNNSDSQSFQNMTIATYMEDKQNRAEANDDNPRKTEQVAFKSAFVEEFLTLEDLRTECKTNWLAIKDLNDSIKTSTEILRK